MSTNQWIDKMWFIHTIKYYSVMKREKNYWHILKYGWISEILSWGKEVRWTDHILHDSIYINVQNRWTLEIDWGWRWKQDWLNEYKADKDMGETMSSLNGPLNRIVGTQDWLLGCSGLYRWGWEWGRGSDE